MSMACWRLTVATLPCAAARNLSKMSKLFAEHYDFFPKTFLLPNDIQELLLDVKARGKKQIYIFKPDAGCQGRGIRLLQGGKEDAVRRGWLF
jgi:hypothetical protein